MPYELVKVSRGYKVVNPSTHHVFSKKALPKTTARKQQIALAISSSKKSGKPAKNYFV